MVGEEGNLMLISHKYKFIFIHIQKTGGSSIEQALREYGKGAVFKTPTKSSKDINFKGRHLFAREVKSFVGDDLWRSYFKFCVVRNPWSRLLSWYRRIEERGKTDPNNKFWQYVMANSCDFGSFLTNCQKVIVEKTGEKKSIIFNQLDYITDENCNLMVDHVIRFENLEKDFTEICKQLKISASLPHINRSRHHHYSYYYDNNTRQLVSDMYQKDISFFKYSYEDKPLLIE